MNILVTIEDDLSSTDLNMSRALREMKLADKQNNSRGGMVNKVLCIIFIVVSILFFLSWILS